MEVFRKDLESFVPYIVDEKGKYNLSDNENRILDWSNLGEEMLPILKNHKFAYYGNSQFKKLKQTYSQILGVKEGNLIPGVGSDQIIMLLIETFLSHEDVVLGVQPDFSIYESFTTIHGAKFESYDLPDDYNLKADDLLEYAKQVNAKMIMLSNPNNPLSIAHNKSELEKIIEKFDGIVVIDEAYVDFSNIESYINKIDKYDNLVVLRTLSKSFGLAGLRLGFGISNEKLIYEMSKVIPPYNLSDLIAEFAVVAMAHKDRAAESVKQIVQMREEFKEFLIAQNFEVFDSQSNFLTFTTPFAKKIYDEATKKDFSFKYYTQGRLDGYIRLSIGTKEEMELLKEIITEVVK